MFLTRTAKAETTVVEKHGEIFFNSIILCAGDVAIYSETVTDRASKARNRRAYGYVEAGSYALSPYYAEERAAIARLRVYRMSGQNPGAVDYILPSEIKDVIWREELHAERVSE
jgi:hypothetical protein